MQRFESAADDPEPQLISNAIAAFYQNNYRRRHVGLPTLPNKLIPGITMVGTAPIFYRIPVTEALVDSLITASFPAETVVLKFVPPVLDVQRYVSDGMRPLENRRVILQCFEAFKAGIVRLFLCLNTPHSCIVAELSHAKHLNKVDE